LPDFFLSPIKSARAPDAIDKRTNMPCNPGQMSETLDGLTVVVMAYNEARNLAAVTAEIGAELARLPGAHEVLIIDDGSSDGTGPLADELARGDPRVRVIHHERNRGLGAVYRTAFGSARGAFVTFFPADGQAPAALLHRFLPLMRDADMVLGYLASGEGTSPWARGLALAERAAYRLLCGPMPRFKGIFMFRRSLLSAVPLSSTGERDWVICMELIFRAAREGYRVTSVPTELRRRATGRSKVNSLPVIWANLRQILKLRWILGPGTRG